MTLKVNGRIFALARASRPPTPWPPGRARLCVKHRLADEVLFTQFAVALQFGFGQRTLVGSHFCLQGGIGRIEAGQRLAGLDPAAQLDRTHDDLAADAEGQVSLVARPDLA
jgi:hypothetical protein